MRNLRGSLLASTIVAGLVAATPVMAAGQTSTASTETATEQEESKATTVADVVITGSRIRRNEFTSTQPVQVITAEEATLAGMVDTAEILQSSTAASTAQQIDNFFTGFNTVGGPGVNTISLRGLGASRTLVIINGRRAGPAGVRGQVGPVDLNVIPSSQIERMEILTDGASSIYGSDAVAGVVNFITRTNMDGGRVDAYYSQPFNDGGEEMRISGGYGWTRDRGYLTIGADYSKRNAIYYGDRDYLSCPRDYVFADSNYTIPLDVIDPSTNSFKCVTYWHGQIQAVWVGNGVNGSGNYSPSTSAVVGGGIRGCDRNGWAYTGGGNRAGCPIPAADTATRRAAYALTPYFIKAAHEDQTAISPVERYTFTAFAGYDLTPTTEIFGELLLNRRESSQAYWSQLFPTISPFHSGNPFGGVCNNFTSVTTGCHLAVAIGIYRTNFDQEIDYGRGVAGIRGKLDFGRGLDWELAAQFSRSDGSYGNTFVYNDRFEATTGYQALYGLEIDSETSSPGGARNTQFRAAGNCDTYLLSSTASCLPGGINWFTADFLNNGKLSAEEIAWLTSYETGGTVYDQKYIEGFVSTELFDLPAGPVGAALGFQIREESIDDLPGIQNRSGNVWGQTSAQRTVGKDRIKEIFGEAEIPLLRNIKLFEELTLNLSGRFSDYDSYGSSETYKVGLNWRLTPSFRIRASTGTSFRAPSLYEMYLGDQTGYGGQGDVDPCRSQTARGSNPVLNANCLAAGVPETYGTGASSSVVIYGRGGRDLLSPETGEASTIGFIWTPTFADLNIALDYYTIEIKDQVARFGATNIVRQCYYSENFSTEPFCAFLTRNDSTGARPHEITRIIDNYVNVSRQQNEGLDLTVRYAKEFAVGDLTLNMRATHILNWEQQLFNASVPTILNGRINNPEWVGNVSARFDRGDWTVAWNADVTGPTSNADFLAAGNSGTFFGQVAYWKRETDLHLVHSMSIRKRMDDLTIQFGMRNIFDVEPPITSASGGGRTQGNSPSNYDYAGRRAYLNVTYAF